MTAPRWQLRDTAVCVAVVGGAVWLAWLTGENLSYHWNWQAAWGYVVAIDEADAYQPGLLLFGLATSIRLLLFAGALALLIGVVVAAMLLSPLRGLAVGYVEALRNLPPLVFMFIFFYFASTHLFNALGLGEWLAAQDGAFLHLLIGNPRRAENFISGVLCLALLEGAFFAEIMRAGVLSIDRGQWDAARSIGLGRWHTLRLVILPQVLKNIAAPLVGQLILLIKDSAILSVISVPELTFSAQEAAVSSRQIFEIWLIAAGFYFALCWPLLRLAETLENRGATSTANTRRKRPAV